MTRKHETETNLEIEPTRHAEPPVPANSELAYDRLSSYGFARRYVGGKIVADIAREGVGYGSRLLAEIAESVMGLTDSPETVDLASAVHSSPNLSYQKVDLPQLPFPEDHFDVVVALGVIESLEHPENLMRDIKRVLKGDGGLVISALDRQTDTNDRDRGGTNDRRAMYVAEFRELLGSYFGHVQV